MGPSTTSYYFEKQLFRKLCNATTISKPLFRKTSISKNNYFAKLLFRKKKTISQNYYFEKQLFRKLCNATTISQKKLFRKQLFRKTTISKNNYFASCVMQLLFRKKNYFEKLLFRKDYYFGKQLFRKITISQVV